MEDFSLGDKELGDYKHTIKCNGCQKIVEVSYETWSDYDKWDVMEQFLCPECEVKENASQ